MILYRPVSSACRNAPFRAGFLLMAASALPVAAFFPPVEPGIPNRPAILLETNFYVFTSALELTEPDLDLTLDARGYTTPATVYLYWEERATQARTWYNQGTNSFGSEEIDVFGAPGAAQAIDLTGLGSRLGASSNTFRLFGSGGVLGGLPRPCRGQPVSTSSCWRSGTRSETRSSRGATRCTATWTP